MTLVRTRWAAIGAAVAVTLGGGGIAMVSATSPADAVTFVPITPCRVIDTRPADQFNVGPRNTPVGAEEEHSVTATGNAGKCTEVPTSATAVSLNVTALNATLPTFLAVYATGEATPDASSLNPQPGAPPTPNAVTTELSAGGAFTIFNKQGSVDVLADINGYYVDHHHDDRYYTKAQVDSAVDASTVKTIQLPVSEAALGSNAEYSSTFGRAGIRLDDNTSNSSFRFSFVLPSDYTTDSTFTFDIMWSIAEASCTVGWQRASSTWARPGQPLESGDIETTLKSESSGGDEVVNVTTFDWVPDGAGAQAGDAIHVAFYRTSSGDSCTMTAIVHGVTVDYS